MNAAETSPSIKQPSTTGIAPGSPRAWLLACRPATLTAAVTPVLVGTACAHAAGHFNADPALSALFGAVFLQIGSNLTNDVFDFEKGSDTSERLGPPRAALLGLLTPKQLRWGMALAFSLATAVGLHLTILAGPAIVAIGLFSIASAMAYTAGPYPLGYHGLGDVFVLLFFGFVAVCGTAFVQVGAVPQLAWVAAMPIGALATTILVINNVRDIPTDVKSGKRTLPVRFGRRAGELEYGALLAIAYLIPLVLLLLGWRKPIVLLPVLMFPVSMSLFKQLKASSGRELNPLLVASARVLFAYGVLFAVGIVLG